MARLTEHWQATERGAPSLVTVYGRRQVGKTLQMHHFRPSLQGRAATVYFTGLQAGTTKLQLEAFRRIIEVALGEQSLGPGSFGSWREALGFVADHATRHPTLLVLDEVPYLVVVDRTFASGRRRAAPELRTGALVVQLGRDRRARHHRKAERPGGRGQVAGGATLRGCPDRPASSLGRRPRPVLVSDMLEA